MTVAAQLTVTGATVWLYFDLPKGFMPTQDTGVMYVRTVTTADISFAAMEECSARSEPPSCDDPRSSGLVSYIGTDNGGALSNGQMLVALKPPAQRKMPIQQVIARLRERLAKIEGVRTFFMPLQDLNLGVQIELGALPVHPVGRDGEVGHARRRGR